MNDATTYEGDLKVYTCDGEEWVVARDPDDAAAVYAETGAEPIEDVPWTACDPAKVISWNDDGDVDEGVSRDVTYAELAKKGRGYLGSANY